MTHQSGSSHFRALFESALQDYEQTTSITLANHPLSEQLENCHSVESISAILRDQAPTLSEFQGSDRIMMSIKNIVSVLWRLSVMAAVGDDIGLVCQKALIGTFRVFDKRCTEFQTCESNAC